MERVRHTVSAVQPAPVQEGAATRRNEPAGIYQCSVQAGGTVDIPFISARTREKGVTKTLKFSRSSCCGDVQSTEAQTLWPPKEGGCGTDKQLANKPGTARGWDPS